MRDEFNGGQYNWLRVYETHRETKTDLKTMSICVESDGKY